MAERSISMKKGEFGVNVSIIGHKCYRCHHAWIPREEGYIPEICPKCKSPYWKTAKKIFRKGEKKNGKN